MKEHGEVFFPAAIKKSFKPENKELANGWKLWYKFKNVGRPRLIGLVLNYFALQNIIIKPNI